MSERLKSLIQNTGDDAIFETWMALHKSNDPEQKKLLQEVFFADVGIQISYIRFLTSIDDEKAATMLAHFLKSENETIVDSAKKSFDRNPFPNKLPPLIPVFTAPTETARTFALDKIASGRFTEAVEPIIKLLPHADREFTIKILSTLRYLPDKLLVQGVSPYLSHHDQEIRFRALFVFGAMIEERYLFLKRFVLPLISDQVAKVRMASVWALRQKKSRSNRSLFLKLAEHDPDPLVRQEALQGLASFHDKQTIQKILSIQVEATDKIVTLKAESILLSFEPKYIIRALKPLREHQNKKLKNKALLLYADLNKHSLKYANYLAHQLNRAKDDLGKVPLLEAIGHVGNKSQLETLKQHLYSSPLSGYTALAAIIRLHENDSSFPFLVYLSDPKLSDVMKQMVIKFLLKFPTQDMYSTELVSKLISFLKNKNLNIRYLSALALSRLSEEFIAIPMLQLALTEEDPTLFSFLKKSITATLSKNLNLFPKFFQHFKFNPQATRYLITYLAEFEMPIHQCYSLTQKLLSPDFSILFIDYPQEFANMLLAFLIRLELTAKDLLKLLEQNEYRNQILSKILQQTRSIPGIKIDVPVQEIIHDLKHNHFFSKELLMSFLGLAKADLIIPIIVSLMHASDHHELNNQAKILLNQHLEGA